MQNLGYGGFYTIPTQAMKYKATSRLLGSSVGHDPAGNNVLQNEIFDPQHHLRRCGELHCAPVPGQHDPADRMDPAAKRSEPVPAHRTSRSSTGTSDNDYYTPLLEVWTPIRATAASTTGIDDKNSMFGSFSWSNTEQDQRAAVPGRARRRKFLWQSARRIWAATRSWVIPALVPVHHFRDARRLQPSGYRRASGQPRHG